MSDVITVCLFACDRPTQCSMADTSYLPCILQYHITQNPVKESLFNLVLAFWRNLSRKYQGRFSDKNI